jgi:hypothetical protein
VAWGIEREMERGRRARMAIREDMLATRMGPIGLNLLQQDWSNLKICFQKVNWRQLSKVFLPIMK